MFRTDPSNPAGTRHLLVAAIVAGVLLATVFAAVRGAVPAEMLPTASPAVVAAIPHLNAVLSVLAIGTIAKGWRAIRRGRIRTHRRAMLVATALFAAFLTLYLYRLVIQGGPHPFPGPTAYYRFVYLPVLIVHIALALCCIPLLSYVLVLGLTIPPERLGQTLHPRVGRVAAILWLISFALGTVVYSLLYLVW